MRRYHEHLRRLTPVERFRAAVGLTESVRRFAVIGIKQRHPQASDHEVRVRLAARLYGREVAKRLYGEVPEDAR